MDIVIVAQYMRNIANIEQTNSRFWYIAKMLKDAGHEVEIVTSDFNHEEKKHFLEISSKDSIKITMCNEPGYPRNVCLKRFYSHSMLAKNIRNYLRTRKKPDIMYVAIPSLSVAKQCANYAKGNAIKLIIDIQDLWPEAYRMVFNVPGLSDICFAPMTLQANSIYKSADEIVAVSKTYSDRAQGVNKKVKKTHVVYLGTDSFYFDKVRVNIHKEGFVIGYVGRLSDSYDLITIFDAVEKINDDVKLLIMGDGPNRSILEKLAKEKKINCEFAGMLPYETMVRRLTECSVAVNPIRKGSAGSIINKVADYAMAGIPVINTQECQEYRDMIEVFKSGINCRCENTEDVYDALLELMNNPKLLSDMSESSRRMGLGLFDRKRTYKEILELFRK